MSRYPLCVYMCMRMRWKDGKVLDLEELQWYKRDNVFLYFNCNRNCIFISLWRSGSHTGCFGGCTAAQCHPSQDMDFHRWQEDGEDRRGPFGPAAQQWRPPTTWLSQFYCTFFPSRLRNVLLAHRYCIQDCVCCSCHWDQEFWSKHPNQLRLQQFGLCHGVELDGFWKTLDQVMCSSSPKCSVLGQVTPQNT